MQSKPILDVMELAARYGQIRVIRELSSAMNETHDHASASFCVGKEWLKSDGHSEDYLRHCTGEIEYKAQLYSITPRGRNVLARFRAERARALTEQQIERARVEAKLEDQRRAEAAAVEAKQRERYAILERVAEKTRATYALRQAKNQKYHAGVERIAAHWSDLVPIDVAYAQATWESGRQILRAREAGATLDEIGDVMGVGRERVRQLEGRAMRRPSSPVLHELGRSLQIGPISSAAAASILNLSSPGRDWLLVASSRAPCVPPLAG